MTRIHRIVGAALLLLSTVPFYRMLASERTGTAGSVTLGIADGTMGFVWLGTTLIAILAIVGGMLAPAPFLTRATTQASAWLTRPSAVVFSAIAGTVAALLTAAFTLLVLDGLPNNVDAMAQLIHARYIAAGQLAGPVSPLHHFWHIPNTVATDAGWVSQYPPAHTLLLALGVALGAVWLVPAVLAGVTVFFTGLVAALLFPERPIVARLGTLLLALSLFFIGLAGAYMNHVTAAACIVVALYGALRARGLPHGATPRDGGEVGAGLRWALLTGAALALCFATRPLSALVAGLLVSIAYGHGRPWRDAVGFVARATAGAAPVLALLMLYNARFFGGPLALGYAAGTGAATGLGFHVDPWGNTYGAVEALAYTSADLATLSLFLNEWPIPVVAFVGLYLLLRRRLEFGALVAFLWAVLPVAANALYWHHGQFMGPRMLAEFAPGWALLVACALVGLHGMLPASLGDPSGFAPRRAFLVAVSAAAIGGFAYLAPLRVALYADVFYPGTRLDLPDVEEPALVFVHEAVGARASMRLAAHGMPMDSIERAMNTASICDVLEFSRAYAARSGAVVTPAARPPRTLQRVEIVPGLRVRVAGDQPLDDRCRTELEADRAGTVDLFTRLWRGDLPGLDQAGSAMFVRDFGPVANADLIARYPERTPFVLARPAHDQEPRLMSYEEGMRLWSR